MGTIEHLDWLILKEICRSASGIQPFTLHRRLSITASQLAAAIARLGNKGYVEVVEDAERIKATTSGIARLQNRAIETLPISSSIESHEDASDWIWRDQLEVNAPYLPKLDLL